MYIKAYLKNSITVLIEISKLLNCKGNRLQGGKGTRDYISKLGLSEEKCKLLFGVDIETLLKMALTLKDVDSYFSVELKIPKVDYKAIQEMVFVGAEPQEIVPLNDEFLKMII